MKLKNRGQFWWREEKTYNLIFFIPFIRHKYKKCWALVRFLDTHTSLLHRRLFAFFLSVTHLNVHKFEPCVCISVSLSVASCAFDHMCSCMCVRKQHTNMANGIINTNIFITGQIKRYYKNCVIDCLRFCVIYHTWGQCMSKNVPLLRKIDSYKSSFFTTICIRTRKKSMGKVFVKNTLFFLYMKIQVIQTP